MQPISFDEVVAYLSSTRLEDSCLIFFVDGGDEAARNISAALESYSDSVPEKHIVIMTVQYHSELHTFFEDFYGPTPVNSVTFVSRRGAAFIRWNGQGSIEEALEEVLGDGSHLHAALCEFGYPSVEFERDNMLGNSDNEEVPWENGAENSLESMDTKAWYSVAKEEQASEEKEMQAGEEKETDSNGSSRKKICLRHSNMDTKTWYIVAKEEQASEEKEMQAGEEKETDSNGSSGKKNSPGQSKEVTVLQIRSPDGSSVTKTFKTSSLLSEVREVIAAHFSINGFGLASSFPRHHYASEEYSRDLGELDLWPNAVLLIVPAAPRQENNDVSLWRYTANLSSWPYILLMYMWNRISRFFPQTHCDNTQPETHTSDRQANVQQGPSGSRRNTNIHTLRDKDKDDDKRRTTYNGNSTQQL